MANGLMPYFDLSEMIGEIDEPNQSACDRLLEDNRALFEKALGSSYNHQAWAGGYLDHVREVMNIALHLYFPLNRLRPLPFSLSDALLVLFLHDLEKPWKYEIDEGGNLIDLGMTKDERAAFRDRKLKEYGIVLNPDQQNAMEYVEGEIKHYSNKHRYMGELAAFCHMCDVASARLWHDQPKNRGTW